MNVLLIIADALRADRLHCYGYPKETSPFIDKLAGEGVLFLNTIANCNHTLPGVVSLLTGLYQNNHRIKDPKSYLRWKEQKKNDWKTPLNILRENGYKVTGVNLDFCARLGLEVPSKDIPGLIAENKNKKFFIAHRSEATHLPYNPAPPYDTVFLPEGYHMEESTGEKLAVVKTKLMVHRPGLLSRLETGTVDPIEKEDYTRTAGEAVFSEIDKPAIDALYDGEVRILDNEISGYAQKLEDMGILNDTIIVLTSDHGEQLLERGALGHSSCSLEGNLYDENIKIPFVVRCPSLLPAGKAIKKQVSQVDAMPTIFDMLGFQMPERTDGRSLLPLVKNEGTDFREEAYAMTQPCGWQMLENDRRMIYGIRTPAWKLIYYEDPDHKNTNRYELFNLEDDPAEEKNLVDRSPDVAAGLKKRLHRWMERGGEMEANDMPDR